MRSLDQIEIQLVYILYTRSPISVSELCAALCCIHKTKRSLVIF